LLIAAADSS